MKLKLASLVLCLATTLAMANTAPTPVIVSAVMRPGTTLMDVVYRVNDPDDATVKTRALAFINGTRSFANVIKPTALVEGTAVNLGDAITTNADHTLTWDVAVDWSIDVGQLKFEILALDGRGLLQFDWIAIPAAGGNPALSISKDTPADNKVLDALFWQYASGDLGLSLASGILRGGALSGNFAGVPLASGATPQAFSIPYIVKMMNLDLVSPTEMTYASIAARAELANSDRWHAVNRPYSGVSIVVAWGASDEESTVPASISSSVVAITAGYKSSSALRDDGRIAAFSTYYAPPSGLNDVIGMAAGGHRWNADHLLAVKSDGSVVGWGLFSGVPDGLTTAVSVAAGTDHSLALRADGTVLAWGGNAQGQCDVPVGLNGVSSIAASSFFSLVLKNDGTVAGWGWVPAIPTGLSDVKAIAAGGDAYEGSFCLALKNDGTVIAWGTNNQGQCNVPPGLTGVIAIAAGGHHSMALKNDGTIVAWGLNDSGQCTIPVGLTGVTTIAAGGNHSMALKAKAP